MSYLKNDMSRQLTVFRLSKSKANGRRKKVTKDNNYNSKKELVRLKLTSGK